MNSFSQYRKFFRINFGFLFGIFLCVFFLFPSVTHAAVTYTLLDSNTYSGGGSASISTSGSVSWSAGDVLVVTIHGNRYFANGIGAECATNNITMSGAVTVTWQPTVCRNDGNLHAAIVLTGVANGSGSGTITGTLVSGTFGEAVISVVKVGGLTTNTPIVQVVAGGDYFNPQNLDFTPMSINSTFMGVVATDGPATFTPASGWTEMSDATAGNTSVTVMSRTTYTTSCGATESVEDFTILFCIEIGDPPTSGAIAKSPNNLGLVGYWSLNEGTSTVVGDYSGSGHDGTLESFNVPMDVTSGWKNGKLGKALVFDGSNDYAIAPINSIGVSADPDITISFWVNSRATNGGAQEGILQYADVLSSGNPFVLVAKETTTGRFEVYVDANYFYIGAVPNLNQWYLITITRNSATNDWFFYRDGVQVGGWTDDGTPVNNNNANSIYLGNGYNGYFNGSIDEVRLYNRALSASEITKLYTSSITTHKSSSNLGLVGYWNFNEGSGTTAFDYSGNHRDGDLLTYDGVRGPQPSDGKAGAGLIFSASGTQYVGLPDDLIHSVVGTTGSLSLWFKTASNGTLFGYNNAGFSAYVPILYVGTDGLLYGEVWMGTVNPRSSTVAVNDGKWHLATITWAASTQTLYIDGVATANSPLSGTIDNIDMIKNTIGRGGVSGWPNNPFTLAVQAFFDGNIDEVRIYNRALSASDVASLYSSSGKAATFNSTRTELVKTGLVGYWPFDGKYMNWGTGKALDVSGAGNDGVLQVLSTTTSPVVGKVGQALNFRGGNGGDAIALSSLAVDTSAGARNTVAFWVYCQPYDEGTDFFSMVFGFGTYDLAFYNNTTYGRFFGFNSGNGDLLGISDYTPFKNTWIHVVGIFYNGVPDSTNNEIWINGVKQTISYQAFSSGISRTVAATARISGWTDDVNYKFRGKLDDVRVYNRALTASEITRLYNATKYCPN